ncbi:P-loop containing nucleoside triphosphate hydrolase protein [Gautieria morchelliformis]|nr:P-loop containing nucleoside triphosphate hydrolase protein [Gautieria morchelliformis]
MRGRFFSRKKDKNELDGGEPKLESNTGTDADTSLAIPEPQKPLPGVGVTDLFRFATKLEIFMDCTGIIAAVAAGAAQPLMSLFFGNLTNSVVNFGIVATATHFDVHNATLIAAANDFRAVAALDASYITYIGLALFICTYTFMFIWSYTGHVMAKRVREAYLRAVLRQDIAFFDNVGAGEIATRIQTDTHLLQQGTSEKVALVFNYTGAFFSGFILAYIRSWRLALALSSILPCMMITGGLMGKFLSAYMQLGRTAIAESGSLAEEVISTIRTAHAFGTQTKLSQLYDGYVHKSLVAEAKAAVWQGCGLGTFFFIIYAGYALAFSFGATLILQGNANVGQVITVFSAIFVGSASLTFMAPTIQAISNARGAAAKLYETIERIPSIDSASPHGLKPENVSGLIEFDHVQFNYPSRPSVPVIKDITISFEAGKTTAIVGASGSGKSTIVSLVERFYDPISGAVKLDGQDVKGLNIKWLRSQIGLVSQEPTLFSTTIEGNVAHGLIGTQWETASPEEKSSLVKAACIKANADGFISNLPDGYQTKVGEQGFLLSGGQKQRVAIARAIVSNPRILLLDEATSALDTQSEGVVQDALDKAASGRTTITIAHRLSTIKLADRIYVMGAGVVLEEGTHDQLLARQDSAYAELVKAQQLREERETVGDRIYDGGEAHDEKLARDSEKVKATREEVPLSLHETASRSVASEIFEKRQVDKDKQDIRSIPYLFSRIGNLNRDTWPTYLVGSAFAIVAGMIYPVYGIVYGISLLAFQITDRHGLRVAVDRDALWIFIIAIVAGCQNYLFGSAAAKVTYTVRSLSFKAIMRQDIEFFDEEKNTTGGLISGLSDNPQKVSGLAGITLGAIIQSTACLVGGCIIGLAYGWKLALVGIACIPFVITTGFIHLYVVVLKDERNKAAHESSAHLACEAAGAIRTVASLTREDDCCTIYSESLLQPLRESKKTSIWSTLLYSLSQAMVYFAVSLVFWYGSRLVASTEYNIQQFFTCLNNTIFGALQAGNVFAFVPDMSSAKSAANNIVDLLDSIPEIDAAQSEGKKPDNVQGHVRFEDVHFRYPTRPGIRVLRDLNLDVKPGTYIALVGASGCGKSTIIQLAERFYDPLAGHIYLDDQLISEFNVQEYRNNISLVSQEPTLYAGTIRFNILLGAIIPADAVTQEDLEAACRDANILEFIQSLPEGFDTEVGGKGSQLSGGQKQRIAIARALLRNPKVLLLDEATSALDSNSERVVQEALDKAAKGRTTIAIAHRLSTIQNADCMRSLRYFIKDGKVSEAGTHNELLALRGGYYEYVQLQALSKK